MTSQEKFNEMVENLLAMAVGKWSRVQVEAALRFADGDVDKAAVDLIGNDWSDTRHATFIDLSSEQPFPVLKKVEYHTIAHNSPTSSQSSVPSKAPSVDKPTTEVDAWQYLVDEPVKLPNHLANVREHPSYKRLKAAFMKDPSTLGRSVAEISENDAEFYQVIKNNIETIVELLHEPFIIEIDNLLQPVKKEIITVTMNSPQVPILHEPEELNAFEMGAADDESNIKKILEMGFDLDEGRSAYLECGRDVEKTIEKLLNRQQSASTAIV